MNIHKVIVTFVIALFLVASASPANAIVYKRAKRIAKTWSRRNCGDIAYKCDWLVMGRVRNTGRTQRNRNQWTFGAKIAETKKVNNPFLPQHMFCLLGGGIDPWGRILNPFKYCEAEGAPGGG